MGDFRRARRPGASAAHQRLVGPACLGRDGGQGLLVSYLLRMVDDQGRAESREVVVELMP